MTVPAPTYTDVLIIGAGPGGLMAAQALAKLGINVKIIDRRGPNDKYGNADGLMSRTLEVWQSYGLLERIADKACPVHVMVGYERSGEGIVRSVPCANVIVPARYQYDFGVAPETIEAVLRQSLKESGHHVSQLLTPADIDCGVSTGAKNGLVVKPAPSNGFVPSKGHIDQYVDFVSKPDDTLVKVVLQHLPSDSHGGAVANGLNTTETIFAKYVIGADGAHSWVRRHFNIPMEGDQTEYFWGAADVLVKTDFPDLRQKCVIQAATGPVILIPREDDKIRVYVGFSPHEAARNADGRVTISIEIATNMVLEKAKLGLKPYTIEFTKVFWCTVFTVSQMVAAKYSVSDKVFILGDACHTHSPKAGQGANAAIGDAHNLAWKIAHVLRGWAKPSLLRTYEIERRRYAQELIAFDKIIAASLDGKTAADYQTLLHQQNMFTSGIGIQYHSTLIIDSGLPAGATQLEAGYRLPPVALARLADWRPRELQDLAPSDGLFKLFLFPGDFLVAADAQRLQDFSDALTELPETANWLENRVALYTILNSEKERAMWSDMPCILRDWKRVFVAMKTPGENVYSKFGVSPEGAAVLVRPDGHMSLVAIMSQSSARKITDFLAHL